MYVDQLFPRPSQEVNIINGIVFNIFYKLKRGTNKKSFLGTHIGMKNSLFIVVTWLRALIKSTLCTEYLNN